MLLALALTTLLAVDGGSPMKVPEVSTAQELKERMGSACVVSGQLERVPMDKGKHEWSGTGLVLDDDTVIYVTYGAPPQGWEALVGARVRVQGVLMPSIDDHSQSLMAPHLRTPERPVKAPRALSSLVGKRARLSGVARNAKGGAVLLIDGQPLYLQGLEGWPSAVDGKLVVAGGTVVDTQHLPQATKDAKGAISQGAVGTQLVLQQPTWRAAEPPPSPERKK